MPFRKRFVFGWPVMTSIGFSPLSLHPGAPPRRPASAPWPLSRPRRLRRRRRRPALRFLPQESSGGVGVQQVPGSK